MHITVYCPSCNSRYQLDAQLRGKQIRCPNPVCREVFTIPETETEVELIPLPDETPFRPGNRPVPDSPQRAGSVGEMVPILPAEPAPSPVERPPPSAAMKDEPNIGSPTWQSQPPPVRSPFLPAQKARSQQPLEKPARPSSLPMSEKPTAEGPKWQEASPKQPDLVVPATMLPESTGPVELPPGAWTAPPVRRGPAGMEGMQPSASEPGAATFPPDEASPRKSARRRASRIIVLLFVLVVGLVGSATSIVWKTVLQTEDKRHEQARKEYEEGRYGAAALQLRKLKKDYPESQHASNYEFFAELSETRDQVYRINADPEKALDQLRRFLKNHAHEPLLADYASDIWQTYRKLTDDLIALAQQNLGSPANPVEARRFLAEARQALAEARDHWSREAGPDEMERQTSARLTELDQAVARVERLARVLNDMASFETTPEGLHKAQVLVRREGLQDDPQAVERINHLKTQVLAQVVYEPNRTDLRPRRIAENILPGVLIVPRIGRSAAPSPEGQGVITALARGVLYALRETDGRVMWATRVGIDTAMLPVRLPASETAPEIILVLSSETNTLTARDVLSGEPLWRHDLKSPCLGRPLIIGRRAYVPTYDGKVHEIEIVTGHLLGWYRLGLPLTAGGARQGDSSLLYFPADRLGVYALDVSRQKCVGILESGHPSGSLRSEPIIINGADSLARDQRSNPRFLVLNQTDGLGAMKLRAFPLPIEGFSTAAPLQPETGARGWSWFPPLCDGEKIVLITDSGVLGLFGIRQPGNTDLPLFLEMRNEFSLGGGSAVPVRSQVIHVAENDFWVLAGGKLQLLHFNLYGQQIVPLWRRPLILGSPLHGAQVDEKSQTLFTVTQSLSQRACMATAIAAETGDIRWQRQVGMLCQGEPVILGEEILILEQGGSLIDFDPRLHPRNSDHEWQTGGRILGDPLDNLVGEPFLLAGPEGRSALEIACVSHQDRRAENRFELVIRRYESGKHPVEKTFVTTNKLQGTPGVLTDGVLLPLDNGTLMRQPLEGGHGTYGPGWRSRRADEDARGHVTVLDENEFLTTDGSRGLSRWRWPVGEVYREEKKAELPQRITAVPLVWRSETAPNDPHVFLADAGGFLRLLRCSDLKEIRAWDLKGKITAGPFLRGRHVGCVVTDRRLVWISPASDRPAWEYQTPGQGIVGRPRQVGNLIVVADTAGRFYGLDPTTGKPIWLPGYALEGHLAPVATPVGFGSGRAFVPLADGTVLLLPLERLRSPVPVFTIW